MIRRVIVPSTGYNYSNEKEGRSGAQTPSGVTPKGLASMLPYDTADGQVRIPLYSKKYPGLYVLVDAEDLPLVGGVRWYPDTWNNGKFYAVRSVYKPARKLLMHRVILGLGPGDPHVDHVNGDGLDNRRANLRECTESQNAANRHVSGGTSRFRGVYWNKKSRRWQVTIKVGGKAIYLGSFLCEVDAGRAYNEGALRYFGEFANLNDVEAA